MKKRGNVSPKDIVVTKVLSINRRRIRKENVERNE